jgi:endonuclease/exonuclease/phosphatase family metal-dependent hydrolase
MPKQLRIMTYNVHRCVGGDGRLAPDRIALAISEHRPDVVALQELDVNRPRSGFADQASLLAAALKMNYFFFPAFELKDEHFGNAVLTRLPMSLVRAGVLPVLPGHPGRERRAAIWVAIEWAGHALQVVSTHLGLSARERVLQVDALLSAEWTRHPNCHGPLILCGDLNAIPGSRAYRHLRRRFHDPFPWSGWPPGTFPAWYPLLRLDHVMFGPGWTVHGIQVPRTRLTRVASDHLPLVVDVSLQSPG